jgi:hypothetical protein
MRSINGRAFYNAAGFIQQVRTINSHFEKDEKGKEQLKRALSAEDRENVARQLEFLRPELIAIGARLSIMTLDSLKNHLASSTCTYKNLDDAIKSFDERVRDEMSLVSLFVIEGGSSSYYSPETPHFGKDVADKFPSVVVEVDEAGKCLALDRGTASAFHSIRCLEAGIRAISRCLNIPDPTRGAERSWFKLLKAIKDEMDRRWPPSTIHASSDAELFGNAHAALAAMQNPWRNSTMHLDQIYTSEDAKHIFDIVGGFMRKIASRMDEDGSPKL